MAADDAQLVSRLPWIDAREERRVLVEWNATAADYPRERCFHELFEAHVERAPEAVAAVFGEESLTYRELNARANRLAHYLRRQGVEPDARVAIRRAQPAHGRGVAGDVEGGRRVRAPGSHYPAARLAHMLVDSAPVAVLVDRAGRVAVAGLCSALQVDLELNQGEWGRESADDLSTASTGVAPGRLRDLHVRFHGGAQGGDERAPGSSAICRPAQAALFDVGPSSRVLQFASPSFDASVWEVVMALGHGSSTSPGGAHPT